MLYLFMQVAAVAERKFSADNWRIFDELREEQRKLQIFNDTKVSEDKNRSLNSLLLESYDGSSTLIDGNKIVDKYCNDYSSNCMEKSVDLDDNGKLNIIAHVECDELSVAGNSVDIASADNCLTQQNAFCKDKDSLLFVSENKNEAFIPPAFKSLIYCLLNIKRFQRFLKDINREMLNKRKDMKEQFPTILFFLEAYNLVKKRDDVMKYFKIRFQVNELTASLHDECPSSILISMLELLHEELVDCKIHKYLKKTCYEQCRFTIKQNHTAVSHLFRGYLKKKTQCECGHIMVVNEAFTSVTISLEDLEEKLLFVKVIEGKGTNILSTRFSFTINNWSTVGSLKEKIIFMNVVHLSLESLVICLIDEERQPHILNDSLLLFELMVADGEVYVFQTNANMLKDETSSSNISYSCSNKLTCTSNLKLGPKSKYTTQLFVHFYSSKFSILCYILMLKFPSLCLGLDIYKGVARLLGTSFTEFKVYIKNENKLCIFCMTLQCSGCPLQLCDKIRISEQYYMIVFIDSKVTIEEVDDISVTENEPLNVISLNECLRSFTCKKEKNLCQACFQLSWKPSEMIVLKSPAVLIIQISNLCEHKLLYQNEILWPMYNKQSSNQMFSLSSLVIDDTEHTSFIKHKRTNEKIVDENIWIKHSINDSLVVTSLPSSKIELLFYIKNQENIVQKPSNQANILKIKKQKTDNSIVDRITKEENFVNKKSLRSVESCGSCSFKSCYSKNTLSLCNCKRCKCLEQMHHKIIHSRSSLNTFGTVDVSADDDAVEIIKDNSVEKSESFHLVNMLHQAIRKQNLRNAVQHFKDQADVNYLHRGVAAIHLSAGIPSPLGCVFTQLCLDHGADPNLKSCDGMTPLHIATTGNQAETIKLLLKAGGSPNTKDLEGRSCYDILVQANNQISREHCEQLLRLFRGEENLDQRIIEKYKDISFLNHDLSKRKEDCFSSSLSDVNNKCSLNLLDTSGEGSFIHNELRNTDFKESSITEDDLQSLNSEVSFKQCRKRSWELFRFRKSKCRRNDSENFGNGLMQRLFQWFGLIFKKR
ncbi:uncharacterized protein LOC101237693 isoform X2 [Hydra vulgaris]|uniref:uncharacterized protein LOC101237693 isoform X2 n=1 Tax=Hydra vulgaris TaxID=6087 RepID=UPI001F5EFFD7|nr:uncharacterized protein LOC101237693 isoform X2 [Hydra vulgaris]